VTDPGTSADASAQTAARIAAGYAVAGPAIELGAVLHRGAPHPEAGVRVGRCGGHDHFVAVVDRWAGHVGSMLFKFDRAG